MKPEKHGSVVEKNIIPEVKFFQNFFDVAAKQPGIDKIKNTENQSFR